MSDQRSEMKEKAFDFAAEVSKQLITLATGIITLTLTFSDDIVGDSSRVNPCLILGSWILFLLSICCGIFSLMALTGILGQSSDNSNETIPQQGADENQSISTCQRDKGIYSPNVKMFATIQIVLFIAAIVLSVIYGYKSLTAESLDNNPKDIPIIINSTEYWFEGNKVDTVISKSFKIDK